MDKDQNMKKKVTRRTFLKETAKGAAVLTVAGSIPFFHSITAAASSSGDYDILIKGGTVYDGTVNPPRVADIGIKGGRIVAIGTLTAAAGTIIDAGKLAVTPGFIDIHTHCDQAFSYMNPKYLPRVRPDLKGNYNYLYQGVTTVVTGNCGLGIGGTARWHDMSRTLTFGTNVGHLAPHGVIRGELFGIDQSRELTATQLDTLKKRIEEEMEKGAIGVSTGLEYAPGLLAPTSEVIEIAKIAGRHGGIYTTHMRNESGEIRGDGKPWIIASLEEAIETCRKADTPVEISHLKVRFPTNKVSAAQILDMIEQARDAGLDLHADQYPYEASFSYLSILIPNKFKSNAGGIKTGTIKDEYKTEKGKHQIRDAIEETFLSIPPEKILVATYRESFNQVFQAKTLREIAETLGKSPSECYADMVCGGLCPPGSYFCMEPVTVQKIMRQENIITASDGWTANKSSGGVHPRGHGTFPRKLRRVAIDSKMMTLPAAIRTMTSLPAEKFRIQERGKIKKGFHADIAVIDLASFTDRATFSNPHQYAEGVRHLFVNGVAAITDGKATGTGGGVVLGG